MVRAKPEWQVAFPASGSSSHSKWTVAHLASPSRRVTGVSAQPRRSSPRYPAAKDKPKRGRRPAQHRGP